MGMETIVIEAATKTAKKKTWKVKALDVWGGWPDECADCGGDLDPDQHNTDCPHCGHENPPEYNINNWFDAGEVELDEHASDDDVVEALIDSGHLKPSANAKGAVSVNDYANGQIDIEDGASGEPLYQLELEEGDDDDEDGDDDEVDESSQDLDATQGPRKGDLIVKEYDDGQVAIYSFPGDEDRDYRGTFPDMQAANDALNSAPWAHGIFWDEVSGGGYKRHQRGTPAEDEGPIVDDAGGTDWEPEPEPSTGPSVDPAMAQAAQQGKADGLYGVRSKGKSLFPDSPELQQAYEEEYRKHYRRIGKKTRRAAPGMDPDSDPSRDEELERLLEVLGNGPFEVAETYDVVTPESAEEGDYEDSGFSSEPEEVDLEGLLSALPRYRWTNNGDGTWYEEEGDVDYRTGAETRKAFHARGLNKQNLTPEQIQAIDSLIQNSRLKTRLEDYLYERGQAAPQAPAQRGPSPEEIAQAAQQGKGDAQYGVKSKGKSLFPDSPELQEAYEKAHRENWRRNAKRRRTAQVAVTCRDFDDTETQQLVDTVGSPDGCDTPSDNIVNIDIQDYYDALQPSIDAFTQAVGNAVTKWIAANNPPQEVVDILVEAFENGSGGWYTWMEVLGHGVGLWTYLDPKYGDFQGDPGFRNSGFDEKAFGDAISNDPEVQRTGNDLQMEVDNQVGELCPEEGDDEDEDDEESEPGDDEEEPTEPQADDYLIQDEPRGGYGVSQHEGKFLGKFPSVEKAEEAINRKMHQEGYFPNVWDVDERGGVSQHEWILDFNDPNATAPDEQDEVEEEEDEDESDFWPAAGEYYIDATTNGIELLQSDGDGGNDIGGSVYRSVTDALRAAESFRDNYNMPIPDIIWVIDKSGIWKKMPTTAIAPGQAGPTSVANRPEMNKARDQGKADAQYGAASRAKTLYPRDPELQAEYERAYRDNFRRATLARIASMLTTVPAPARVWWRIAARLARRGE